LKSLSATFWKDRSVFVTGHTGFKGSWLVLLLNKLGARVTGYSLVAPVSKPSLFDLAHLADVCADVRGDIRDMASLKRALEEAGPSVLIHMAAQPIVRLGVDQPLETLDVNVMGTANVLQAARALVDLKVFVSVTSDKCYDNQEVVWAYRECDAMGGKDPYSASKGCAELVTSAFARTYYAKSDARVISVRAGNVIGGGDWAEDRLIPDLVRSAITGVPVEIRSPASVRPWQHVLDPIFGYLLAAERAFAGGPPHDAWNFGPNPGDEFSVADVVRAFQDHWPEALANLASDGGVASNEAGLLRIDNTKAKVELGWRPLLDSVGAIASSASWYRAVHAGESPRSLTEHQIDTLLAPPPS
jgi:CDP-glucose 4,6-dehydratase